METHDDIVSLDPKHRGEDVVDYHFGDLAPEARAEFEKHLATCPACQQAVKTANLLFPAVSEALAVPKSRATTEELVSMMMAETQRLETNDRAVRKQARARTLRRVALWSAPIAAAAAAALIAAGGPRVVVDLVEKLVQPGNTRMVAPPKPKP